MDSCAECGYDYDLAAAEEAAEHIAVGAAEIALMLNAGGDLRERRQPAVWSPLEYGCHVRDVLLVQRERVLAALRMDTFVCVPMGRDERVEPDGYAEQDPLDVARQLTDAALLCANVLDRLRPQQWDRTLIYGYPEPSERPLRWVALHTVHEVQHHAMDIGRQL
ncbi:MAG: DinB family protein [Thermocrispum sp.]